MSESESDDDLPCLLANGDTAEEQMEGEEMMVDSLQPAKDLFSSKSFPTAEECVEHMSSVHGLDLGLLARRLDMDTFSFIRFVNYVRQESPSPGFVMSLSSAQKWEDPKFMKPVLPDDPLLMYDFDQALNPGGEEEEGCEIDISRELDDQIAVQPQEMISLPLAKFNSMKEQFEALTLEVSRKEEQLRQAMEDMTRMRETARDIFSTDTITKERRRGTVPVSEALSVEEDQAYFSSYAHYSIHHEMLSDRARTLAYKRAITENKERLGGSTVMDLGCGTGILSMFCAEAGASRVVGVDCSDIIYQAMDIVRENKLESVVTLVKGRLEETQLPVEKVDIIVSEWMGYFLLFEGMLDSVLSARDKYLAEGGTLLPNRCSISLGLLSDLPSYERLVTFWDDVYGYKMSCFREPILAEATVQLVEPGTLVSSEARVLELDLNTCAVSDTEFTSDFTFTILKSCSLTAVVGWFDTYFDLATCPVVLSTHPASEATHWKQTVFYLPSPLEVQEGQELGGRIVCKRMRTDARALKVAITLGENTYKYTVD